MEKTVAVYEDDKIKIETIDSFGDKSPQDFWYDQEEDEFVYLVCGSGSLEFSDGHFITLNEGESFLIEKHKIHRVASTSKDCKWLCVFVKER